MLKKAKLILLFASILTIFTVFSAVPIKADPIWRGIYVASPHPYTPKWPAHRIGHLHVWNDASNLYVEFRMLEPGWEIKETHLEVATCFDDIPQTKSGNPKVGKFTYKMEYDPAVIRYTYTIPLDSEWTPGTTLYIAAHSVVQNGCQEETAWANCQGPDFVFPGNNWASFVTYVVQ